MQGHRNGPPRPRMGEPPIGVGPHSFTPTWKIISLLFSRSPVWGSLKGSGGGPSKHSYGPDCDPSSVNTQYHFEALEVCILIFNVYFSVGHRFLMEFLNTFYQDSSKISEIYLIKYHENKWSYI